MDKVPTKVSFLLGKPRGGRSSPWIGFKEGDGSSLTVVFCVVVKRKMLRFFGRLSSPFLEFSGCSQSLLKRCYLVGGALLWGKKGKRSGIPSRCAYFGRFGRKGIG